MVPWKTRDLQLWIIGSAHLCSLQKSTVHGSTASSSVLLKKTAGVPAGYRTSRARTANARRVPQGILQASPRRCFLERVGKQRTAIPPALQLATTYRQLLVPPQRKTLWPAPAMQPRIPPKLPSTAHSAPPRHQTEQYHWPSTRSV